MWALALLLSCSGCRHGVEGKESVLGDSVTDLPGSHPNIVVFLTDDQRQDTVWAMPIVQERLAAEGVVFANAYVNTPLCCPARASLLSGGFLSQQTGVLGNEAPNGGVGRFPDTDTMATTLQRAGYRTGLLGKYLNGYDELAPAVPPGWDTFRGTLVGEDWNRFDVVVGSSTPDGGATGAVESVEEYVTEYISDASVAFLDEGDGAPFFLLVSYAAPHFPMIPAEEDVGAYAGEVWRGGAWNEADVSDKPADIQALPLIAPGVAGEADAHFQEALESLLSADRAIGTFLDALEERGKLEDTVIIFASDNGYLWGEHRIYAKGYGYEESVRVPLIVRAPGAIVGERPEMVSVTLDVSATIYDMADVDGNTAGESLAPLLTGGSGGRDAMLLEAYDVYGHPDYAGLVTPQWKYMELTTGEAELYDLVADAAEMDNLSGRPDLAAVEAELSAALAPQKGLAILTKGVTVPFGEELSVPLEAWGGEPPYTWEIADGRLPDGLVLRADGLIVGTPTVPEGTLLLIEAIDSSVSPFHGGPQRHASSLRVEFEGQEAVRLRAPLAISLSPGRAEFRLAATGRAPVAIAVGVSPEFDDGPRRVRGVLIPDAETTLTMEGLHPGATYYVRLEGLEQAPIYRFQAL